MNRKDLFRKAVCVLLFLILVLTGCSGTGAKGVQETGRTSDSSEALPAVGKKAEEGAGTLAAAAEENSRLQVVTTIFPQYDFSRQIGGDCADVAMLLKPGEEVHSYEPTPQDIKTIQNSDLFIYVGGENDVWVDNILDSVKEDGKGPRAVRLLDLVETYAEEHLEGMMEEKGHSHEHEEAGAEDHDHSHEHEETAAEEDHDHEHEEEPDEHVWTSPENCVILIEKLTDIFCETDPANAAVYRENGDACRTAFEELDAEYREMAAGAARRTILFGDRFPFRYLAEELGLTCYAAFSGCSSESEPSAATIAFLIDKAYEERLPVVFQIEFSNGNIARAICEAVNLKVKMAADLEGNVPDDTQEPVRVLRLHSCHNLTRDEFQSGETCLSLMTKNLEALREALGAAAK
ncbi:MAG: zinc ABC transporter substrate-binding protein [Lachnospiraceae bacterium]|nr:zinc ABC transporter substrate-binding protein [Lachnospiraceae bacterium]